MSNQTFIPADRVQDVQASITLRLTALAKSMQDQGEDVVSFGAGEPDFDTPHVVQEAGIHAITHGHTRYTAESGILPLRKAIANRIKLTQRLEYSPDEILVSCGAKHSIYNAIMALVNKGDEIIFPAPYWVSYPEQVRLAEGTSIIIPTTDATQFKMTPAQLKAALTPKTKLIILTSPSNPTGMSYSESELAELGSVILSSSAWILSDEIYADLIYDNKSSKSIAAISEALKDRTLLVNGLSKAYAMTGWRIGYTAGRKDIIAAMSKLQGHSTSNPTTPSQYAGIVALEKGDSAIAMMKAEFVKRRDEMVRLLNAIPGISCLTPDGAFYAFPNISNCFGKKSNGTMITDSMEFCDALLTQYKVACVPGYAFGSEGHIRLSYATSLDQIQKGLTRIDAFVRALT